MLSTVTAFAANVGQASGTNVNVRAGASTGANVLGKINKGTEYTVLDKVDNWFKISYNGTTGYVFADYFSVTKADGSITGSGVNLRKGNYSLQFSEKIQQRGSSHRNRTG